MKKYTSIHHPYIKIYIKLTKCFSIYIPINIIRNILNEEDIDLVIDDIFINKDLKKLETEIETYESIEELKYAQNYEDGVLLS